MRICYSAFLAVLAASAALGQTPAPQRPWTLLVYGAADNNADGPILRFLDSIRQALDDDPGIELLLLIDRSEKFSKDARSLGEDFSGARLYRLRRDTAERLSGGEHFPEISLDREWEMDSADATNIDKFITWGKARYPARRYGLLIYSHADGQTMCPDEHSQREMGIAELTAEVGAAQRVDFLALELCNMGGIEIAYQWRPGNGGFEADVLLAIPNAGPPLDWHRAFERIRSAGHDSPSGRPPLDPAELTAADFGRLVIEEGYRGRQRGGGAGPSPEAAGCYDLAAAADVKRTVDSFGRTLAASDSRAAFLALRGPGPSHFRRSDAAEFAFNYGRGGPFVDLYDLCRRAAASAKLTAEVRAAAKPVMESVDRFVIASFGMDAYPGFEAGRHGVFVVLPPDEPDIWPKFQWYTPRAGTGSAFGRWAFLADGATAGNGVVENWFELLDSWFDAGGDDGGLNGYRP